MSIAWTSSARTRPDATVQTKTCAAVQNETTAHDTCGSVQSKPLTSLNVEFGRLSPAVICSAASLASSMSARPLCHQREDHKFVLGNIRENSRMAYGRSVTRQRWPRTSKCSILLFLRVRPRPTKEQKQQSHQKSYPPSNDKKKAYQNWALHQRVHAPLSRRQRHVDQQSTWACCNFGQWIYFVGVHGRGSCRIQPPRVASGCLSLGRNKGEF